MAAAPHHLLYEFAKAALIKIFAFPYATVCYTLLSFLMSNSFRLAKN